MKIMTNMMILCYAFQLVMSQLPQPYGNCTTGGMNDSRNAFGYRYPVEYTVGVGGGDTCMQCFAESMFTMYMSLRSSSSVSTEYQQ